MGVTRVFHLCLLEVIRVLEEGYKKGVTKVFLGRQKVVTRVIQWSDM